MNSRERVLTALRREEPDCVPYCEFGIDRALVQPLMGWGTPQSQAADLEANPYSVEEAKAIAARLHLDNPGEPAAVIAKTTVGTQAPRIQDLGIVAKGKSTVNLRISDIAAPTPLAIELLTKDGRRLATRT